jgi:hypothetical protein
VNLLAPVLDLDQEQRLLLPFLLLPHQSQAACAAARVELEPYWLYCRVLPQTIHQADGERV